LAQLVTDIAGNHRAAFFVAVQAPGHFERLLQLDGIACRYITVATPTFYFSNRMFAVAEEYELRQLIYPLGGDLPVRSHIDVADFALGYGGKARAVRALCVAMAGRALQF